MEVKVHYAAQLRRAAGVAEEACDIEAGVTVLQLFRRLASRHESDFRTLLLDAEDQIQKALLIFVGEEQAAPDRVLHDGDEVLILAPMAGG